MNTFGEEEGGREEKERNGPRQARKMFDRHEV